MRWFASLLLVAGLLSGTPASAYDLLGAPPVTGIPAPAAAAGFTQLAFNADFSQPGYSNIANWVDGCGGSSAPPRWWFGWWGQFGNPPHQGAPCSALIMEPDAQAGGKQVLHLQYLPAYNAVGSDSLSQILTLGYPIQPFGTDTNNYFPSTYYIEIVARQTLSSLTQSKQVNNSSAWSAAFAGGQALEEDEWEVATNTGPPLWQYGSDGPAVSADWTTYHTYGTLFTSDGTGNDPEICAYFDGNLQPPCQLAGRTGPLTLHNRGFIFGWGTDSNNLANGTITNNVDIYIQSMKVWTCPGGYGTATNCFGTVITH